MSRTTTFASTADRQYAISVARACGGALLFSLPILMTMETWQLGAHMERLRLALLLVSTLPLLVGLAYYLGFEDCTDPLDAALDAFVAIAVAALLAALILYLFGALNADTEPDEWIGKVSLQTVTGSIGALLAQSQFGRSQDDDRKRREGGDFSEYFFMAAGALFLGANIAPTEEIVLIAHMMTPWHSIALLALSLGLMHAFVYALDFKGQHRRAEHISPSSEFARFTILGYLIALGISAYVCWTFGRFDGLPIDMAFRISVVLAFPSAIGAAAARLVL